MNCPVCDAGTVILKTLGTERRRKCVRCQRRFTTTEVLKEDHKRLQEAAEDVKALAEKLAA